jgi:hypothetical protein
LREVKACFVRSRRFGGTVALALGLAVGVHGSVARADVTWPPEQLLPSF